MERAAGSAHAPLVIPYGIAEPVAGAAFTVEIDRARAMPLRLNNMRWQFPNPPDPERLAGTDARLAFLEEHLVSLCDLWSRPQQDFVALYFRAICATVEAERVALTAALGAQQALLDARDWSFSAFCPLPRAHLALGDGGTARVDFAFWTGTALVAVEIESASTPRRDRRAALASLEASGVGLIAMPRAALAHGDTRPLAPLLEGFWRGEPLPSSPFRPASLARILPGS